MEFIVIASVPTRMIGIVDVSARADCGAVSGRTAGDSPLKTALSIGVRESSVRMVLMFPPAWCILWRCSRDSTLTPFKRDTDHYGCQLVGQMLLQLTRSKQTRRYRLTSCRRVRVAE